MPKHLLIEKVLVLDGEPGIVTLGFLDAPGIGLPDLYREFEKVCGTSVWGAQIRPLGGGNSNILIMFTPKIGEDEPILTSIFFRWVGSTMA